MNNPALPQPGNKLLILSMREEEILKAIAYYRYMTVSNVTRLFGYAYPASLKYVGKMLTRLAGGQDYQERSYLYRFPMPNTRVGNTERVYTLGATGRAYLSDLGLDIDWYFRPHKTGGLTYSHLLHPLALTRFLVTAQVLVKNQPKIKLTQMKIEYELRQTASEVTIAATNKAGKTEEIPIAVVPDAWLDFSLPNLQSLPILLEIDRGTEQQQKFKQHVAARIAYVRRGGGYSKQFGTEYVSIAYATTGSQQRLQTMLTWTEEVMRDLGKQSFSRVFHFLSLPQGDLDPDWLFLSPTWKRPFEKQPVALLS